jgi:catechol 2,3-dioxygenase-like lactoylglutathione lyase family enzyme
MRILGLIYAGTATGERAAMASFVESTLGLRRVEIGWTDSDMFALPDGSHFGVADPRELGNTDRTIGFRVANLDEACADLGAAGIELDEPVENDRYRYVHFRAPDGKLYELVEDRLQ